MVTMWLLALVAGLSDIDAKNSPSHRFTGYVRNIRALVSNIYAGRADTSNVGVLPARHLMCIAETANKSFI